MSNEREQGRWEFDENGNVRYVEDARTPEQPAADGSYRYSYRSAGSEQHAAAKNTAPRSGHKGNDTGWHWVLIILGFVAVWPIGLILLILELTGKWPGSKELSREAGRVMNAMQNGARQVREQTVRAREQAAGAREAQAVRAGNYGQTTQEVQERLAREKAQRDQHAQEKAKEAEKAAKAKSKKKKKKDAEEEQANAHGLGHVRLFRWIGGIMAGLFGFAFITELVDDLTYSMGLGYTLRESLPLMAFCLIGVTLIALAGSRKRKLKKFQKYLSMIGKKDMVSIGSLAEAMGVSEKEAEKDLREMLDRDFWSEGYVDAARRALVLSGPIQDAPPEQEIDQEVPGEEDQATATLRHIRTVNDAIADADMSDKIYRIEELTGKIFKLLEEHPEKAGELRTFMNYYLPQTLKILERYSELEAQGVEGENITEAKAQIEGMMDKLVDGYETQLDKLFANDVLDISADIKVMEQMLEKDGLAMENELRF